MVKRKPYFQSQIHTTAAFHVFRAIPVWYLSAYGQEKTVLSIANSHQCNIPSLLGHSSKVFECLWSRENRTFNRKFTRMQHPISLGPFQRDLSTYGQEKTVLSIANSHHCIIPCLSGHSSMVFESFWSRENGTFNHKFTPMQHSMSLGPFQYGI